MSDELNKAKDTEPVEVPKREWKKCKLGDELELLYGKGLKESERCEGNYPVYGSNGIVGYHNEYLVKAPGIIIGRKGSVGEVKFSSQDFFPIDTTYYVSLKNNSDIKFFYYFLLTLQLNEMNSHSAVPGLNRNDAYSIDISLPPLPEQKAIAGVLSSLDDKIDLLHRQNKTLEAMAETLFRQWFTSSEKLKVKSEKLGELVRFIKGKKPKDAFEVKTDGLIPQILIETLDNGKTLYSDPSNMIIAEEKDILMVMDGASSGRVEIGFSGIVGTTIGLFHPLENFNYPLFLFYFLKTNENFIKDNTTGSAIPHADKALILDLDVEYDLDKVKQFEKFTFELFEKKQINKNQIRTLEKLRDTLLPKLMSGEVRVNPEGMK